MMKHKNFIKTSDSNVLSPLRSTSVDISHSDLQDLGEDLVRLFSMGNTSDSSQVRITNRNIAQRVESYNHIIKTTSTTDIPSMVLEEQIQVETWLGKVVLVETDSVELEVRNDRYPEVKRKLRVQKENVVNIEHVFLGIGVEVKYIKKKNYQAKVEESITVTLRVPPIVPQQILDNEYKEKLERYKYMWEE